MVMRRISEVLDSSSPLINTDPIDPDRMVFALWDKGVEVPLDTPVAARHVTCPTCQGTDGYYFSPIRGWACRNKDCFFKCSKKGRAPIQKEITLKGRVPEIFEGARFEHLHSIISHQLKSYVPKFQGFVLFNGNSGRGKTYAACALMHEFLKLNESAKFISQQKLHMSWIAATQNGEILHFFNSIVVPEFLIIDDIGHRTATEEFKDFFLGIVNERYTSLSKTTIFTTNFSSDKLTANFSDATISRLGCGLVINFGGSDRRYENG